MAKEPKTRKLLKPGSGKVLIAAPFLSDYYFGRSVVLLADHGSEGSFGIVMNKPLDIRFNDILDEFPSFSAGIYVGGPVKSDSLFFVHTLGESIPQSVKIIDGLYWGGDIDEVRSAIVEGRIEARQIRFFLGYSGWAPDQLESELKENSWVVAQANCTELLDADPADLWKGLVKSLGKEYAEWINYPIDPRMN
jgi:putative transcriptional regulator